MTKNKTQPTAIDVSAFIRNIEGDQKRKDCIELCNLMESVSGEPAVMWGNIIGFGSYHYKYKTGREGDFFLIGFSPRKANISIYTAAYDNDFDQKKEDLGKVKLGKSCIYINQLRDIDKNKLKNLLKESIEITLKRYTHQ